MISFEGQSIKSRMEDLKYKQYIELVNTNNSYLKDFINVLEDSPAEVPSPQQSPLKSITSSFKSPRRNENPLAISSTSSKSETEVLRLKAE
jgi:hypothetical protein